MLSCRHALFPLSRAGIPTHLCRDCYDTHHACRNAVQRTNGLHHIPLCGAFGYIECIDAEGRVHRRLFGNARMFQNERKIRFADDTVFEGATGIDPVFVSVFPPERIHLRRTFYFKIKECHKDVSC